MGALASCFALRREPRYFRMMRAMLFTRHFGAFFIHFFCLFLDFISHYTASRQLHIDISDFIYARCIPFIPLLAHYDDAKLDIIFDAGHTTEYA